jgi:transcriptional regulator with XRE-family HTH domain
MSEDTGVFIAKRIRFYLKKKGKTQAWLAGKIGKEPGYLSELLNGHPDKRWNSDLIDSVIKAFDITILEFFTDEALTNEILSLEAADYEDVRKYLRYRLSLKEQETRRQ